MLVISRGMIFKLDCQLTKRMKAIAQSLKRNDEVVVTVLLIPMVAERLGLRLCLHWYRSGLQRKIGIWTKR
jgi:hypothetical protein